MRTSLSPDGSAHTRTPVDSDTRAALPVSTVALRLRVGRNPGVAHAATTNAASPTNARRARAGARRLLRDIERVVIGRGTGAVRCELGSMRLDIADPHLSVEHAVIERALGGWAARDLGSKNGVSVNGERISQRPLADG